VPATGVALAKIRSEISWLRCPAGIRSQIRAAIPETIGAAIEVPLMYP
jgi:hypothetical protein